MPMTGRTSRSASPRVVCRAAFIARLSAGAVLAEAGAFVLAADGRLLFSALPWLANEERERRKEIAAAAALGWCGEETLRWFIERANGVSVEVCEPFEVEGGSVEEITEGLLGYALAMSLEAPHRERQEAAADERRATKSARSRGRATGGHDDA
jgi:hypothetical protein